MSNLPHAATLLVADLGASLPDHVLAYIGPGAGLGAIIFTIALGLGVLLLVMGLVWYPLKRLLRSRNDDTVSSDRADEHA